MDELPPEEARPEPNLLPARDNLQPRGRAAAAARITALCERIKERTKERRQGGDAAVPQHTAHSGDHPGQHGGANSDNSGTDHARRGVAATTHPGGGEQLARRGTGTPTRPRGGHSAKRRIVLPTRARHSRSGGSLDSKAIQQLLASEGGNIARRGTASPTRPRGTGPHARRGAAIPTRLRQAGGLGDWGAERRAGVCASPDIRRIHLALRGADYEGPQTVDTGSESQPPLSRADVVSASKESEGAGESGPTVLESNPKQSSAEASMKVEGHILSSRTRNDGNGRSAYGHVWTVGPLHVAGL